MRTLWLLLVIGCGSSKPAPAPAPAAPAPAPTAPAAEKPKEEGGAFASLTGTGDISSGFDDTDIYGGLLGDEPGGGSGSGASAPGSGGSGKIGMGARRAPTPSATIGQPTTKGGDLDKAIIRRY